MIIRNFYDDKLAQASYLVGCAATGEAIVIDPLRDIKQYLDMAEAQNLRITAVTETHIHADYLSGSRELAAATGAHLFLSDEGDDLWKYAYANEPGITLVKDGHVIRVGNLTLKVMHTPGHTPEHISFLLTDHPMSNEPHSLFTGDFVFVGDVGRPDLLERAANFEGTMEAGARTLFRSLRKLDELADSLLIWPGHGAGSACGKALGGSPVTTLGYERRTNWALLVQNEDSFVNEVLSGQPEPPFYFKEMKRLNKEGPRILGHLPHPEPVHTTVGKLIDVRTLAAIRRGRYEGSIAIPTGRYLTTWAGWLLDYDQPVTLIADSQEQANEAARDLATIGLDVVSGWVHPDDLSFEQFQPVHAAHMDDLPGAFVLVVRGVNERAEAHIPDSAHIPLGYLSQRLDELPKDRRIIVHCASGGRTPTAYSILANAGFSDIYELADGLTSVIEAKPELVSRG
jgi:hydroxyacylglutathione hydrolase